METLTTKGITISVESRFESEHSADQYVFSYRITIDNNSAETVQLISRHWYIHDASGLKREIKGEGVVGKQPVLSPGERHQYVSWCPLTTTMGKMYGTYQMINLDSQEHFDVKIPTFKMAASFILN